MSYLEQAIHRRALEPARPTKLWVANPLFRLWKNIRDIEFHIRMTSNSLASLVYAR